MFDLIVVGGGIAGLAIAEIFARSGAKTLLLEAHSRLCSEASGLHHEWFHFGSLYSIFPNPQYLRTLVGGIDDLLVYYRDFDGMNLRVTADGKLITIPRREIGWLRDDPLEYAVTTTEDPDFDVATAASLREKMRRFAMKRSWHRMVQQFVVRHERFHAYDWRRGCASYYIPKNSVADFLPRISLERYYHQDISLDPRTHLLVRSFDRPMHATNIIADLLRSFLSYGGELRVDTHMSRNTTRGNGVEVTIQSAGGATETLQSQYLILATDRCLEQHSNLRVRVTASPLLVIYPEVFPGNIVRVIPFVEKTVNHLRHSVNGCTYSVIGGGFAACANDKEEQRICNQRLLEMARAVFPRVAAAQFCESYVGYKTEIVSSGKKRNYLYRIERLGGKVYAVVPGKFSLCFSLAVNTFREITGHYPNTFVTYDRGIDVSPYFDSMLHTSMVRDVLELQGAQSIGYGEQTPRRLTAQATS